MKIAYLLESADLYGGVRIVFDQARFLIARGHEVAIYAAGGNHHWYPYDVPVTYVSRLDRLDAEAAVPDVAVATFWTTVVPATRWGVPLVVHLCQGFEWALPEYAPMRQAIETVYALPIPKITIGDWLSRRLRERFGPSAFPIACVGQIVDTRMFNAPGLFESFKRSLRRSPHRVLVVGIFESWVKGVRVALEAIAQLRGEGVSIHLTRVATSQISKAEHEITHVNEYYHNIKPETIKSIYAASVVLLAPSFDPEGFGLPFAEALACGLPVVASAIPSHLSLDDARDYACFVPEGDSAAMAHGVRSVLSDRRLRQQLSRRGVAVTHGRLEGHRVARALENAFMQLACDER